MIYKFIDWTGEKHSAKKISSSSGSKNSPIKWIDLVKKNKKNLITQNQMFTFVQLLFNLEILGTVENLIFYYQTENITNSMFSKSTNL